MQNPAAAQGPTAAGAGMRTVRMPRPHRRSLNEIVATEIVPAFANAAASGEIAVRRAIEASAGGREAVSSLARNRPFLSVAIASGVGMLLAARSIRRRRA